MVALRRSFFLWRVRNFTGGDDRVPAKDATAHDLLDRGVKQMRGFDSDPSEQSDLLETLGGVHDAMGDFHRANQLLLDAMNERQRLSGSDDPAFARNLIAISSLRDEQGQGDEALNLAQRAYEIDARSLPFDDPWTLRAQLAIGSALTTLGQYTKAAPLLETVVQKDRGKPERLAKLSDATGNLAIAAFYLGDLQRALSLDLEGLAIDLRRVGDKHPDVGSDLITLSPLEAQLGNYAKSEDYGREALTVYRGWFRPGTLRDASTAGTSCQQERDVAAKELQSLASAHAIPLHNP